MGRSKLSLIIVAAILVVGLAVGSVFLMQSGTAKELTWDDLIAMDRESAEMAMALEPGETVSIQNVTSFALLHAGVSADILNDYPFDWNMLSKNTGLMEGIGKGFTETADSDDLDRIVSNSKELCHAFDGGPKQPFFYEGVPQPVFAYTPESDDYSNEDSQTIRYCVFVETGYDTDSDGKRDLIELFLQVPRAAIEGGYKAPVILVASPYDHGVEEKDLVEPIDSYDMSRIYSQPDARVPIGSTDSWDAAMAAKPSDWHYGEEGREYSTQNMCDYFLPRGYAVTVCGLLGSYGSEGYACTGLDLELLAVKSVIEWFDGHAVGYTSKDSLIATQADWCSGDVGMYGSSYRGTIAIGVAAMGIPNLRTVIPCSAISDWYEYVYQKGGVINIETPAYIADLAEYISTARDPLVGDYRDFMQKVAYDEFMLNGQYTDGTSTFWRDRNYTRVDVDTTTSMMLVHGLNDYNVRMCEFAQTVGMFKDSGAEMKIFLHQGAHQRPDNTFVFNLGEDNGMVTINRWLSHYLFGQDTGVESWPDIQVQNNLDGSWSAYTDLDPDSKVSFSSTQTGTETFYSDSPDDPGVWIDIGKAGSDITILGGELRVRMSSETDGIPYMPLSVVVFDTYEQGMKAYKNMDSSDVETRLVDSDDPETRTVWFGSTIADVPLSEFSLQETTSREISLGSVGMNYYGDTTDLDSMRMQDRVPGEFYDYVIDLNPVVYNLKEGHSLVVYITAFDPFMLQSLEGCVTHYDLTVEMSSVELVLELT